MWEKISLRLFLRLSVGWLHPDTFPGKQCFLKLVLLPEFCLLIGQFASAGQEPGDLAHL